MCGKTNNLDLNKEIYVIGGGYSLRNINFRIFQNKKTIVINKSLFYVPFPDYFVTLDHSYLKKMKRQKHSSKYFLNLKTSKIFIANLAKPYLQEQQGRIVDTRYSNHIYDLSDFDVIIKSRKIENFGYTYSDFRNGDNSGYCALQYAILLGYTTIHLCGIDLVSGKKTHFHGGYGQNKIKFTKQLEYYFDIFKNGLTNLLKDKPHLKIYSRSKESRLNDIIEYKPL